jgi:hypothetical protein
MTYLLFAGDMFVMAFMVGVVVWVALATTDRDIDAVAQLPLEEDDDG